MMGMEALEMYAVVPVGRYLGKCSNSLVVFVLDGGAQKTDFI